jgi:hypothetical protein
MNEVQAKILCKCGKAETWITDKGKTKPCPHCGRAYTGKYNKKKMTIDAVED